MSIRSMQEVISDQMAESLAERVPQDVDVVYDVATVMLPDVCPDGHLRGFEPMVRLNLYVDFSSSGTPMGPSIRTSVVLPYWFVSDGDVDPVCEAVDHLWTDAVFTRLMGPMIPSLHEVLAEEGLMTEEHPEPEDRDE